MAYRGNNRCIQGCHSGGSVDLSRAKQLKKDYWDPFASAARQTRFWSWAGQAVRYISQTR